MHIHCQQSCLDLASKTADHSDLLTQNGKQVHLNHSLHKCAFNHTT